MVGEERRVSRCDRGSTNPTENKAEEAVKELEGSPAHFGDKAFRALTVVGLNSIIGKEDMIGQLGGNRRRIGGTSTTLSSWQISKSNRAMRTALLVLLPV